ncbi:MAG: Nramp family divalent metal transporter [Bryobacteraceae bacterium]|nr:Nramp family divalent metal transporter [Bryobacteraceae bacterium]MDW8378372.1 Nramp family divalent metal transporter [Bryobacterales bacterium]
MSQDGRPAWRRVGPAILLTATSVGAGDILTGALAGAEAGAAVLWAVPVGVILKWTLTEGIARWQMATGETLLEGWRSRLGVWVPWAFLAYVFLFTLVTCAMLASACGLAMTAMLPLGSLSSSRLLWAAAHAVAGLVIVWFGGYHALKRLLAVCVGAMFFTIVCTAFLLDPDWQAVFSGLIPSMPAGSARWVIGLIGAVGGTMALVSYGYWIREEGRSGEQGLRECRWDLLLSYSVIAVFGVAVVLIGSRLQVRGQGTELALLLAAQLEKSFGRPGYWIFLSGFWSAVFSALLGVWQSLPYLFADVVRLGRKQGQAGERVERSRPYRLFLVFLATVPLLLVRWPVKELQLAFGLTGAMLLPVLTVTLLLMNNRRPWVGVQYQTPLALNLVLVAALVLFAYAGWVEAAPLLRR